MPTSQRLLTIKETAFFLKLSPRTIYNGISRKDFPIKPVRLGRAVRFDVRDLDSYIEDLKNAN